MSGSQRKSLYLIIISAATLGCALVTDHLKLLPNSWQPWATLALYLLPYLLVGAEVVWEAVSNIFGGDVFDECFLMTLASVVAFVLGEYAEAVIVMLFYQVGELFQGLAIARSRKSIADLMNIRPEYANLEESGVLRQVDPSEVTVGDTIVVKAGERIPLDGIVIDGQATLDTSALTGESAPRAVAVGAEVLSGCIDQDGLLKVRVTKAFSESTAMRILALVEDVADKKSRAENFITAFARWYTPAVVVLAVLLAVLPPLLTGDEWNTWIMRALTFLVISCPCALVISVPLTFFGGIGGASARGILIKGGNYIDALSKAETVVMDKTGTLTRGEFCVCEIMPRGISADELLVLAAAAETYSDHPIARSIRSAAENLPAIDPAEIGAATEHAGRGVSISLGADQVYAGNYWLFEEMGIPTDPETGIGTIVHVARNGVYCGWLRIADELKPEAKPAVSALRSLGVRKTIMLTGDLRTVADAVGRKAGIDNVVAELLPDGKVAEIETLLASPDRRGSLVFVGDGINDAPALALADVGIAMGALGSDAAIEAADVVLTDDNPQKIAAAIQIARKTMRIAKQNIVFSLGVKIAIMALGAAGLAGMWMAVFADVGVCVIAVLNALRAMRSES